MEIGISMLEWTDEDVDMAKKTGWELKLIPTPNNVHYIIHACPNYANHYFWHSTHQACAFVVKAAILNSNPMFLKALALIKSRDDWIYNKILAEWKADSSWY